MPLESLCYGAKNGRNEKKPQEEMDGEDGRVTCSGISNCTCL